MQTSLYTTAQPDRREASPKVSARLILPEEYLSRASETRQHKRDGLFNFLTSEVVLLTKNVRYGTHLWGRVDRLFLLRGARSE